MIRQTIEADLRRDPCRACGKNARTDRLERGVACVSAAVFLLCGLAVVLLEGPLPLAVALGLTLGAGAAALLLPALHRAEARLSCGGCDKA